MERHQVYLEALKLSYRFEHRASYLVICREDMIDSYDQWYALAVL